MISSRFAMFSRWPSAAILAGLVILSAYGLVRGQDRMPERNPTSPEANVDLMFYQAVVERVHAGDSYYGVLQEELPSRGYPTRPFLSWRPPFLAWFLASLPTLNWGKAIQAGLSFAGSVLWCLFFARSGHRQQAFWAGLMLCAYVPTSFSDSSISFHENWAGRIILLSLALHATKHWILAAVAGLVAVLLRELSLPFVLVMLVCASWERKWREAMLWGGVLAAFVIFIVLHAATISRLPVETILSYPWMRFGGWPFVLATSNYNLWLLMFTIAKPAFMLPLALVGLAGWRTPVGLRVSLTVVAYILAFMVAGRTNNVYWGMMYAPLLTLGWIICPVVLKDLWRSVSCRIH